MPKKQPAAVDASVDSVVHIRVDRDLKSALADIAAESGKSANDLAIGALSEFVEMVKLAAEIEAGQGARYDPDDFTRILGLSWIHRLAAMNLAGPGMKLGWREHLAESDRLRREISTERAARKGAKQ